MTRDQLIEELKKLPYNSEIQVRVRISADCMGRLLQENPVEDYDEDHEIENLTAFPHPEINIERV